MRHALFWIGLPFVIPQALYVRRTALRFPPAAGPSSGSVGDGEERRLFMFGDSIAAGVGASTLERALPGQLARGYAAATGTRVNWTAEGYSGANCATLLQKFALSTIRDADLVAVSVGVNDVTSLTTVATFRRNLTELLDQITKRFPGAAIGVAGLPPLGGFPALPQPLRTLIGSRGRVLDGVTRDVVEQFPHAFHQPIEFETQPEKFAPDGYHPSEASYVEFGDVMGSALARFDRARTH